MKNDKFEKNSNPGSIGSGFLLGILLGVLVTLLITTKKGREILRDLMDKIIKKISEIDGSLEKVKQEISSVKEYEGEGNNDYVKDNIVVEANKEKSKDTAAESTNSEKPVTNHIHKKEVKIERRENEEKSGKQENKNGKRLFFRRSISK